MKCPHCNQTIKMPYRKVIVFTHGQEYILIENVLSGLIGQQILVKKGTVLIYDSYNLGYAKFFIKGDKKHRTINIIIDEAFIICRKDVDS